MDYMKPFVDELGFSEAQLTNYYLRLKASGIHQEYLSTSSEEWQRLGQSSALSVFHLAAARVPAYKDFLRKNKVKAEKIKTIKDFKLLPIIDKHNYLKAYPLKGLCLDGDISRSRIISTSSGSTGEPFFWPRGTRQELEGALQVEMFYNYILGIKKPTLIVIGFALGNWISGSFMYLSSELVSKKGYPITILTPGFSKKDILKSIKGRAGDFRELILMGYPPFIKDILDEGEAEGIKWRDYKVKFVFAAESFSEAWRKYVYDKVGAPNYLTGSVNIYGSADAGILAHETPLTIAVRTIAAKDPKFHLDFFGESRFPTLAQYDPRLRYFESLPSQGLIFTASSLLPLVRYAIGDYGGLKTVDEIEESCQSHGHSLNAVLREHHSLHLKWTLPSVYVFGRKDFTATLYGANIYPESVREALIDPVVKEKVTGKFTMFTKSDKYLDQFLSINVELKQGINPSKSLISQVQRVVIDYLRKLNSEYSQIYDEMNHRAHPEIVLYHHEEGEYFQPGSKHRWTKKS